MEGSEQKIIISDDLKEEYKIFLGDTCTSYPNALEKDFVKEIVKEKFDKESVYQITSPNDVQKIIDTILGSEEYKEKDNKTSHRTPSASLKKYKDFLKKRNQGINNTAANSEEKHSLQKILYGAPGTGKSFKIKTEIQDKGKILYRTTFHPDTDYATFVGCYKPCMDKNNNIVYSFTPQVFLIAYLRAWYEYLQANTSLSSSNVSKIEKDKKDAEVELEISEEEKGIVKKVEDVFLVIEEINRGNCAQIFGDIFQLLDRNNDDKEGKKGFSTYPIVPDKDVASYIKQFFDSSQLDIYKRIIKELEKKADRSTTGLPSLFQNTDDIKLSFPPNFHIWATMNTSDQSLYPMDSAFKRRWEWEYVKIDTLNEKVIKTITINKITFKWPEVIEKINIMIKEKLHSADKQIGEFFVKPEELSFSSFRDKVLFYLFGDAFRDNRKFGDEFFDQKDLYLFEDLLAKDEKKQEEIVANWLARLGCKINEIDEGSNAEQSSSEEGDSNAGKNEESPNEENHSNVDETPNSSD